MARLNTTLVPGCDAGGDGFTADVDGQLISAVYIRYRSCGGCQSRVLANYQVNDPDEVENCWVVQGDVYVQSQS